MRWALVTLTLSGMIVTVLAFLADYAIWVNDEELAYEIAAHDLRRLLADCGEDLVCDRPPETACKHSNDVVEVTAVLGIRRRFPFGAGSASASLYFDAAALTADVTAIPACAP